MDTWVQLIRNAMCCIKDLRLFQDTILWDSYCVFEYVQLPPPLDKTMPLEVLIGITQLYVVWSATRSGLRVLTTSIGKLIRIDRLLLKRSNTQLSSTLPEAERLVNASLIKERHFAIRSSLVGFLVFCIGLSFIWLGANSFHITEAGWIGGVPALIHALTVSEIGLAPLLYFMFVDGMEQFSKAKRMQRLAELMGDITHRNINRKEVGLSTLEVMTGWVPFWDSGLGIFQSFYASDEEDHLMEKEIANVNLGLKELLLEGKFGKKKSDAEAEMRQIKSRELLNQCKITRAEGYREFIYLVLNSVAFYGYLLAIVIFYWSDEETQPSWMRNYMLGGFSNNDAEWHGNFIGDLMWSIEPIVILGSPMLLQAMREPRSKSKTD